MLKRSKKTKMTLEKLVTMTQRESLNMGKEIGSLRDDVGDIKKNMATKDDLRHFATKEDLHQLKEEVVDEVRKETVLDILLKEETARTEQYKRQDEDITVLKQKVGI